MRTAGTVRGLLPSGSVFVVEVPDRWNGVLIVVSHPVPVAAGEPPWDAGEPLVRYLAGRGYAVAGSANTIFWPLERAFADHPALVELAARLLGPPRITLALGQSIGGIVAAGHVQRSPGLFEGVMAIGGNLAGAVANHNRELDMAFVAKTLLPGGSGLEVARITNAGANLDRATAVLHEAQATAAGRARLALVAAVGNVPGWHDPTRPEPAPSDYTARQASQFTWFAEVGFLVLFLARKQVEIQAGGNGSWNTGVEYGELVARSINVDEVEALYGAAGLRLDDDLDRLASAEREVADPAAVGYLERHIVFDGDLRETPVVAVHTVGDGLVPPDHEHAYADVVAAAGQSHLLRQLFVRRGGHCTLTHGEVQAALDLLIDRVESGTWASPVNPAFVDFAPRPFSRPHDARDAALPI